MYQVLYRKYRPRVFGDVVGQDHITSTLQNEFSAGRLSHAYLFTGSRGTGKTTCAKILAKAVNCQNPVNGNPCNECEICKGIDNGSIFDVMEFDAASNTGVDYIRELIEETNFTPSAGNYRVYIIDEVHMLSSGAFNALLKTLEEPPEHVIFILATTEIHKVPATILSRCQRFDFKRIEPKAMAGRLAYVAKEENLSLTGDGALLIARIADGALRDALSLLDQCAGRSDQITASLVSEVAGIAGKEYLFELTAALAEKSASKALDLLNTLHQNSCDMERLAGELVNQFRNYLVVKTVKNSRELIICPDDEYELIKKTASLFTIEAVIFILDLFQETLESMKKGANRRVEMEMTFIKLCEPRLSESTSALLERISALENALRLGAVPVRTQEPAAAQRQEPPVPEKKAEPSAPPSAQPFTSKPAPEETVWEEDAPPAAEKQEFAPPAPIQTQSQAELPESASTGDVIFTQWGDVMEVIKQIDIPLFGILNGSKAYLRDGSILLIDSENPIVKGFVSTPVHNKAIKQAIQQVTGKTFRLGIYKKPENQTETKRDPFDDFIQNAKNSGVSIKFE